ncbi:hypothetical protein FS837_003915, partial [Tulasnella sp. UAMH 9824]
MKGGSPVAEDEGKDAWVHGRLRPKFGQVCDFWKRYDELADQHDKEMSKTLNGNLDVLLIFAALFSAINTTFISLTMPSLSPDPMDKTNTLLELLIRGVDNSTLTAADLSPPFSPDSNCVTTNCLLYASLSCSLLAAMGAMLAKEWLQNYDRTGQVGPLEEQARMRQRKFHALQRWHLEEVVLFLPNLLIASVILFFVGLAIYVLPINHLVAGVVIAFICVAAIFVCTMVVAGAMDPSCPYQTALSRALRSVVSLFGFAHDVWCQGWKPDNSGGTSTTNEDNLSSASRSTSVPEILLTRVTQSITGRFGTWKTWLYEKLHFVAGQGHERPQNSTSEDEEQSTSEDEEQLWDARATCWMLEITSKYEDQLIAAQSIFSLDRAACKHLVQKASVWQCLLPLTVKALQTWWSQPTPRNRCAVEQLGAAFCHLLLPYPRTDKRWREVEALFPSRDSRSGSEMLYAFDFAVHGYWYRDLYDVERIRDNVAQTSHCLAVVLLRCLIKSDEYPASDYVSCLVERPHDDVILALLAILVMKKSPSPSNLGGRSPDQDDELVWDALTGQNVDQTLTKALDARATYILYREEELFSRSGAPVDPLREVHLRAHEVDIFTAIIRRTRDLISRRNCDASLLRQWTEAMNKFVDRINSRPPTIDDEPKEALFFFAVEVMATCKILFGTPESGRDGQVIEGYWRLLDWAIQTRPISQEGRELARNRIDEAIRWMFSASQPQSYASGLPNHPEIIAYIMTRLKDDRVSGNRRLKPINTTPHSPYPVQLAEEAKE